MEWRDANRTEKKGEGMIRNQPQHRQKAQYTIKVQITETQFYCSTKEKAHARDENKLRQEIRTIALSTFGSGITALLFGLVFAVKEMTNLAVQNIFERLRCAGHHVDHFVNIKFSNCYTINDVPT